MYFAGVPEQQPFKKAFHTSLTTPKTATYDAIIKFDSKLLDTANAYNTTTGVYVIPEEGIYVLTWTITGDVHTIAKTQLMVNNALLAKIDTDSQEVTDIHSSTGMVVVKLSMHDLVHIQFSGAGSSLRGTLGPHYGQCSFSGWKLD